MAGWGLAWTCDRLEMVCLLYYPKLKHPPDIFLRHRKEWKRNGAKLIGLPPGRTRVMYNIAKKRFEKDSKRHCSPSETCHLLEIGIPLEESIEGTYQEALATKEIGEAGSIVCPVGSGTILSGLLRAVYDIHKWTVPVYGILTRSGSLDRKMKSVSQKTDRLVGGIFGADLSLIDVGWQYADRCDEPVPFPCHRYYDAKAWKWLRDNLYWLPEPVLFWNIGREPE
jgi:hypothetical protein